MAALALVLVVAAVVAYVVIGRFVNLGGQLGSGGLTEVRTPEGFTTSVFAEDLDGPRFIAFGPDGVLHVADRGSGRILALPDANGDGIADEKRVLADGLPGVQRDPPRGCVVRRSPVWRCPPRRQRRRW